MVFFFCTALLVPPASGQGSTIPLDVLVNIIVEGGDLSLLQNSQVNTTALINYLNYLATTDDARYGRFLNAVFGNQTVEFEKNTVDAQLCPTGSYVDPVSRVCTPCASGYYSETPFATSIGVCVACPMGTYSNVTGANNGTMCQKCPQSTYSGGTGQTSIATCQPCGTGASSVAGSGSSSGCTCLPGYYRNGDVCSACEEGYFCAGEIKSACPGAEDSPQRSSSPAMSSGVGQCFCLSRYYGSPTDSANGGCQGCTVNSFCSGERDVTGAAVRKACPSNSNSPSLSISIDNCKCDSSYRRQYSSPAERKWNTTVSPCACINPPIGSSTKVCSALDAVGCKSCTEGDLCAAGSSQAGAAVQTCKQGFIGFGQNNVAADKYYWRIAPPGVTFINVTVRAMSAGSQNILYFYQCKFANCSATNAAWRTTLADSSNEARTALSSQPNTPIYFRTSVGYPVVEIFFDVKATAYNPFTIEYTTEVPCDNKNIDMSAGPLTYNLLSVTIPVPFQPPSSWPLVLWLGDKVTFTTGVVPLELRAGSPGGANQMADGLNSVAWEPFSLGNYWLVDVNYPSRMRQVVVVPVDPRRGSTSVKVWYDVVTNINGASSFSMSGTDVSGSGSPDIVLVVRDVLSMTRLSASHGVVIMSSYTNSTSYTPLYSAGNFLLGQGTVGSATLESSLTWDTTSYSSGVYYYGSTSGSGTVLVGRIILYPASGGTTCARCNQNEYCYDGNTVRCPANSWSPAQSNSVSACICNPGYARSTTDLDAYINSQVVDSGGRHTCAVSNNGTLWCWGANEKGQLGLSSTTSFESTPRQVTGVSSVKTVALGDDFTCVVYNMSLGSGLFADRVKCWGSNYYGQLGLDSAATEQTSPGSDALLGGTLSGAAVAYSTDVLACAGHSCCAIIRKASSKALTCWGRNHLYQLGYTTSGLNIGTGTANAASLESARKSSINTGMNVLNVGTRDVVLVTLAAEHGCAMDTVGNVFCWGTNKNGVLGIGETSQMAQGPSSSNNINLGLTAGGSSLYAKTVNCFNLVCCVVMRESYEVKCWGQGAGGRLGVGKFDVGTTVTSMGINLQSVSLGSTTLAMDVNVGATQTCVLLSNNNVKCWGQITTTMTTIVGDDPPADMMHVLPNYQLSGSKVGLQISGKGATSCAVTSDYQIVCWGDNTWRQLGGTPNATQGNMTLVNLPSGVSVMESSGPSAQTCVGCSVNTFCEGTGSQATTCPVNTYSPRLSTTSDSCKCLPGYKLVSGVCQLCSGVEYCLMGYPYECNRNSATTYSGASDISACQCDTGHYYAGVTHGCTPCPTGQYKENVGNDAACRMCPDGTRNNVTGARNESQCLTCPAGTMSQSTKQECAICPEGTSSSARSSTCPRCSIGFYSPANAASCTPCPAGTYDSDPQNGLTTTCTPCVAGTFSPHLNATDVSTCQQCAEGYYSIDGAGACTPCTPGTYSGMGSRSCTSCPANSTSVQGVGYAQCRCLAGFYKRINGDQSTFTCEPCVGGQYAAFDTVGACSRCAAGKASAAVMAVNESTCKTCSAGSAALAGSSVCTICAGSTFSALDGASVCTSCDLGFWAAANSTSCTGCVSGRYATGPLTRYQDCLACERGHYCIGAVEAKRLSLPLMQKCPAGTFQNESGQAADSQCRACEPNFYCPTPTLKGACPHGTASNASSTSELQCNCVAGYTCNYKKVINAVVTLIMGLEEFQSNTDVQTALRQAVANAAGTQLNKVSITNFATRPSGGRRLLETDVSHVMLRILDGQVNGLEEDLDRHLASAGLRATPDRAWIEPHYVSVSHLAGAGGV